VVVVMIVIMVAAGPMLMAVGMIGVMVMLALGTVHVLRGDQGLLAPRPDNPDQLPELLRLRHDAP
jgi:hypothetical protein